MNTLYICGAGNSETVRLAQRINRVRWRWGRIVLLDDDPRKHGQTILGVTIAGPMRLLEGKDSQTTEIVNSVTRTTTRRWAVGRRLEAYRTPTASLIDPGTDCEGAELARDIIVYQNATIGPQVSIGEAAAIFMGAVVGHESQLGRCCVVAANAVLNARVQLGDGVYVGSNASVLPEVKVGAWATIAAGSMVMQNVPAGATLMGVPGKIVYRLSQAELALRTGEAWPVELRQEAGSRVA